MGDHLYHNSIDLASVNSHSDKYVEADEDERVIAKGDKEERQKAAEKRYGKVCDDCGVMHRGEC